MRPDVDLYARLIVGDQTQVGRNRTAAAGKLTAYILNLEAERGRLKGWVELLQRVVRMELCSVCEYSWPMCEGCASWTCEARSVWQIAELPSYDDVYKAALAQGGEG